MQGGQTMQCICSNCDHSDNCQSTGAKCCICTSCDLISQCSKPGSNGCKCNICTMAENNCCQPGSNSCLCDECPNIDCKKGHAAGQEMKSQSTNAELRKKLLKTYFLGGHHD